MGRHRHLLAGVGLAALMVGGAQAQEYAQVAPVLQGVLDALGSQNNIQGLSVAVDWNGGSQSWYGSFGYADPQHTRPITSTTQFRIGSASKTVTGTVVMRLADQGLVNLDAPINTYVADLNIPNGNVITVRNLLSMTSGLPDYLNAPSLNTSGQTILQEWANFQSPTGPYGTANYTPDQLVQAVVQALGSGAQKASTIGTMAYSNTNFVLLGIIAQRVTNQAIEQLVQDLVFTPMGMTGSAFPTTDQFTQSNYAGTIQQLITQAPYTVPAGSIYNMTFLDPQVPWSAGAMLSTPSDELKWVRQIATNSYGLLSASMQAQRTNFFAEGEVSSIPADYGLALYQQASFGSDSYLVGHSGLIGGYTTSLFLNSDADFAYAINFLGYQANPDYWYPFFGAQAAFANYGYQIGAYSSVTIMWLIDRAVELVTSADGNCSFGAVTSITGATVCSGGNVTTAPITVQNGSLTLASAGTMTVNYVDPNTGAVTTTQLQRPTLAVFGSNMSGVALQGNGAVTIQQNALMEIWGDNSAGISMSGTGNSATIAGTLNTYSSTSDAILVNGSANRATVQSTGSVLGTIDLEGSANSLVMNGTLVGNVLLGGQGNTAAIGGTLTSPAVQMIPSAVFNYQIGSQPFVANTATDLAIGMSGTNGLATISASGEVDGNVSMAGQGNSLVISGTLKSADAYLREYIAKQIAAGTPTPSFTIPTATPYAVSASGTQGSIVVNQGGQVNGIVQITGSANNFQMNGGMVGLVTMSGDTNSTTVGGNLAADTGISSFALLETGSGNTFNVLSSGTVLGNLSAMGTNRVIVNGMVIGAVDLGGGAVLSGSGFVNGTVGGAGGIVSPGNSVGVLTVGNYVADGGILQIETDASGVSDLLIATNIANLSGGTLLIQPATGAANGISTVVMANSVQGTFAAVNTGSRIGAGMQYTPTGATVATVSPFQVDAATRLGATDIIRGLDVLERRISQFQNIVPTAPAVASAAPAGDGGERVPDWLTSLGSVNQGSRAAGSGLWVSGYGALTRLYGNGGVPTIDADGGGVMLGIDGVTSNGIMLGAMASYSHYNASTDTYASPTYESDAYSGALYAAYEIGRTLLSGSVLIGRGDDEASQTYLFGTSAASSTASFNDWRFAGRLAASSTFEMGTVALIPRVAVSLLNVNVGSYTETGLTPAVNASWSGSDYTVLRPEATLTLRQKFDLRTVGWSGWLIGEIETGIARDVVLDSSDPTVLLPGFSPILVQGYDEDDWAVPLSVRLGLSATPNMSLYASYDANFSSAYSDQSLRGGVQIRF